MHKGLRDISWHVEDGLEMMSQSQEISRVHISTAHVTIEATTELHPFVL